MKISTPTFKTWIIIALAIVIIYLVTCNKKTQEVLSNIPTPAEQLKPVIINEGLSKIQEDSIINLLRIAQGNYKESQQVNEALQQINVAIQQDMDDYISIQLPDTCKEYQNKMIALNKKLAESAAKKDAACKASLENLNKISQQKDALLANCKKDYKIVRAAFDTALDNQKKLQKIVKPSRIFSVGITGLFNYNNSDSTNYKPKLFGNSAVGVTLDYMNRKGTSFGVGVFNTKQVQITFKKPLFRL